MADAFDTTASVSPEEAWSQELCFEEPCRAKITIENLGSFPLYAFHLDEDNFERLEESNETDPMLLKTIEANCLCDSESGTATSQVEFGDGVFFVCIELDGEAGPKAEETGFRFKIELS